ncbi:MAG: hypothetical protein NZM36_06040 [Aquificaceae bacterium]|nr:hypothetical protein [Aquificaceae bacterium]
MAWLVNRLCAKLHNRAGHAVSLYGHGVFESEPMPERKKRRKRHFSEPLPATDFRRALKEIDTKALHELKKLGLEFFDYEDYVAVLMGAGLWLVSQTMEHLYRLFQIEPKTAELTLEIVSLANQTLSQINGLVRSLSLAHKHEIGIAVFLHSVFVRQAESLMSSSLPEPAKKEVLELLSKSLREFQASLKEDRTERLKVAIAHVFGDQPLAEDRQNAKR